jgi:hypothetical protein
LNITYLFGVLASVFVGYHFRLTLLETGSVLLFFTYLIYFIDLIGKKIILLEIASFTAILTWLIAPIPFYHFFNEKNELAVKWVKVMPLSSNEYYSFVLPATLAMILGFSFPMKYKKILYESKVYFPKIREYLKRKSVIGFVLIFIGFAANIILPYSPGSITFLFYLLSSVSMVGLLYLYFSDIPFKRIILWIGFIILFAQSVITGMFGELIYMVILVGFLIFSEKSLSFFTKSLLLISGIYFIFLIQSVKQEYRAVAWYKGVDPVYFGELIFYRIASPSQSLDERELFGIMMRLNQGWLICKTMYHVPKDKPYAYGTTIGLSLAATIVPRFIWPSKPKAGGVYNLERFWGYKLTKYSMNIGPIGEAYGNFGKYVGIIFMFFYGLFFNFILNVILKYSVGNPTWLIWLPFLFLYAIGTETDMVSTFNYLVKSFIFLFLFRILMFGALRIKL